MERFCKKCPDRGGTICVLPKRGEWLIREVLLNIAASEEGLGRAKDAEIAHAATQEGHAQLAEERAAVRACIRAHQGNIQDRP